MQSATIAVRNQASMMDRTCFEERLVEVAMLSTKEVSVTLREGRMVVPWHSRPSSLLPSNSVSS